MENNNKFPDIKPDLSKLSQSVDFSNASKQTNQKVIVTEDVQLENPEIIINRSNKKLIWSIFAIVMAVIIAGSLLLFVFPKPVSPMDIAIELQANYELIEFEEHPEKRDNVMPGDQLKIKFVIKSIDDLEGSTAEGFIRVKFYSTIGDNYYANMFSINSTNPEWADNWIEGADGYYYLKYTLLANDKVEVTDNITVSKKLDSSYQGKTVTLHMMVEYLQAGEGGFQAIESIWETAPTTWKEQFRNNWG